MEGADQSSGSFNSTRVCAFCQALLTSLQARVEPGLCEQLRPFPASLMRTCGARTKALWSVVTKQISPTSFQLVCWFATCPNQGTASGWQSHQMVCPPRRLPTEPAAGHEFSSRLCSESSQTPLAAELLVDAICPPRRGIRTGQASGGGWGRPPLRPPQTSAVLTQSSVCGFVVFCFFFYDYPLLSLVYAVGQFPGPRTSCF